MVVWERRVKQCGGLGMRRVKQRGGLGMRRVKQRGGLGMRRVKQRGLGKTSEATWWSGKDE